MSNLSNRWRPASLDEILGQDKVVQSLEKTLEKEEAKKQHSYIFYGPPGTGKTSLARILATFIVAGKKEPDVMYDFNTQEIDAARYNKVEEVREILNDLQYPSMSGKPKVMIYDEAHKISESSWTALLKSVEEPPEHVYWIFCTTEISKVPKTIRQRCAEYKLKPVAKSEIIDLLEKVADKEGIGFDDDEAAFEVIAEYSAGSPRQALKFLEMADGCADEDEVEETISGKEASEDDPAIKLARDLIAHRIRWAAATQYMKQIKESGDNWEGARLKILNYVAAVAANQKNLKKAEPLLAIMEEFAEGPWYEGGGAKLLLAVGQFCKG